MRKTAIRRQLFDVDLSWSATHAMLLDVDLSWSAMRVTLDDDFSWSAVSAMLFDVDRSIMVSSACPFSILTQFVMASNACQML
jgi:hypothetical protein